MTKPQPQITVAEQYLRDREQRFEEFLDESFKNIDESQLHDLEITPGIIFKVRRLDLEFYKAVGGLPLSFSERLAQASKSPEATEEVISGMTQAEQTRLASLAAKMARYMCVVPRLVFEVKTDKDLLVDAVTQGDLLKIVNFGQGGGASGLASFHRGGGTRNPDAGANGAKLRNAPKRSAKRKRHDGGAGLRSSDVVPAA